MKIDSNDFYQRLELPSSIARTAKNEATPFTMIDNRVIHADPRLTGLKRGDKEIHFALLSQPDNWDLKHLGSWMAKSFGFSRSTAFRIIARLIGAGLLVRTWNQDSRRAGYRVFEVPHPDFMEGRTSSQEPVSTSPQSPL